MGFVKDAAKVEPIAIRLKNDKLGLGSKDPFSTQYYESIETKKRKEIEDQSNEQAYVYSRRKVVKSSQITSDLKKIRSACQSLDEKNNIEKHWFWPEDAKVRDIRDQDFYFKKEQDTLDMFQQLPEDEKLEMINEYVRSRYYYCVWCGLAYTTREEMLNECPGNSREIHDE
jgi:hypothetical protein